MRLLKVIDLKEYIAKGGEWGYFTLAAITLLYGFEMGRETKS